MTTESKSEPTTAETAALPLPQHIAVGVDGCAGGDDASTLGARIAAASGADLMLVAVHPDTLPLLPPGVEWKTLRRDAEALLRRTRDALDVGARITAETGWSVPRALEHVVQREHRDLLVVGSCRSATSGRVEISGTTRQLLGESGCALAVAPHGYRDSAPTTLGTIGVGYDGGQESKAALALAAGIARNAGASLRVEAVIDDRLPTIGWWPARKLRTVAIWEAVLTPDRASLESDAHAALAEIGAEAEVRTELGSPAELLTSLSGEVDLLVIGSRRWGVIARVLLGGTGEALMHGASCPVLVAPRIGTT